MRNQAEDSEQFRAVAVIRDTGNGNIETLIAGPYPRRGTARGALKNSINSHYRRVNTEYVPRYEVLDSWEEVAVMVWKRLD